MRLRPTRSFLLGAGLVFMLGCDFSAARRQHCEATGECECSGTACCVRVGECGEGLPCCSGLTCEQGRCEGAGGPGTITVVVTRVADAGGRIVSTPAGIDCGATCTAAFPTSAPVTLTAEPEPRNELVFFDGGIAGCSAQSLSCTIPAGQAATVAATFQPYNLAFTLTPPFLPASLGGVDDADARCQTAASNAQLPGRFLALLAADGGWVGNRYGVARGWVRPDGRPVADTMRELFPQSPGEPGLLYSPGVDQGGLPVSGVFAWTGLRKDGLPTGENCLFFTSHDSSQWGSHGSPEYVSQGWVQGSGTYACDEGFYTVSLYCFGADFTTPVRRPAPKTGRLAFISKAAFRPGDGGIALADELCAAEARTANLTGSFRAVLAQTGVSPSARFDAGLPGWSRVDGLALVASPAELLRSPADTRLLSAPWIGPDGVIKNFEVLTGSAGFAEPGSAATTCDDWTVTTGSATGGDPDAVSKYWFASGDVLCSSGAAHIYCFQE